MGRVVIGLSTISHLFLHHLKNKDQMVLKRMARKRGDGTPQLGACEIGAAQPDLRPKIESKKALLDI